MLETVWKMQKWMCRGSKSNTNVSLAQEWYNKDYNYRRGLLLLLLLRGDETSISSKYEVALFLPDPPCYK